jgi:enterochelin esterase family protein
MTPANADRSSELYKLARQQGNPIIRGESATFLWRGRTAPLLVSDLGEWEERPQRLTRLGRDLWAVSLKLPRNAYLEYSFYDPQTRQHLLDPLNTQRVSNGVGGHNAFFYMPEAAPTPLAHPRPGRLRGRLTRHQVDADGMTVNSRRAVYLYQPASVRPVPLLVVLDGFDYLRRVKIVQIVETLIAQQRIQPIALALLQNGGNQGRMVEYACSEITLAFLEKAVLPLAASQLKLLDHHRHPGAHGILGSSMGGLMAVYAALRLPEIFGNALSQSGAFELWGMETAAMQLVRWMPKRDIHLWMDVGRLEELLACNRRMRSLLLKHGYEVGYHEFIGGHNPTCWRDDVGTGLETLYG